MLRRVPVLTAILILAAGPALAEPEAPPPPAGPSPQPVPYPGDPQPPPPQCTNRFCIPQPGTGGVAAKKHIGQVKYEDSARSGEVSTAEFTDSSDAPAHALQVVGLSWGKLKDAGTVYSADPMEGGQVAGQSSASVAERRTRPGRPTFGNLVDDAPVMVAEPVAKGTATFKTLAGLCATGKHLDKVKITTRSGSHTLHDATIVSVTPADPVDGQAMEQVTLSYDSVGD